jgi:hypothetical protein
MLKWIYQKRQTDCGVACVAMLCDASYDEAKQLLFGKESVGITSSGELLQAIRHFGGKPLADRCQAIGETHLPDLDNHALLKGKLLCGESEPVHWAVWDCQAQAIRDPYGYDYPFEVTHFVEIAWDE